MTQRGKTLAIKEWELRTGLDLRTEMMRLQAGGMSQANIAKRLGYNEATVNRWFRLLEIPARRWMPPSEAVA